MLLLTQLTCSLTSLNPIPTHFRKVDLGKAILKQALTTVGGGAYHENPRDKFILFASFAYTSFSYIFKNLNMVMEHGFSYIFLKECCWTKTIQTCFAVDLLRSHCRTSELFLHFVVSLWFSSSVSPLALGGTWNENSSARFSFNALFILAASNASLDLQKGLLGFFSNPWRTLAGFRSVASRASILDRIDLLRLLWKKNF